MHTDMYMYVYNCTKQPKVTELKQAMNICNFKWIHCMYASSTHSQAQPHTQPHTHIHTHIHTHTHTHIHTCRQAYMQTDTGHTKFK